MDEVWYQTLVDWWSWCWLGTNRLVWQLKPILKLISSHTWDEGKRKTEIDIEDCWGMVLLAKGWDKLKLTYFEGCCCCVVERKKDIRGVYINERLELDPRFGSIERGSRFTCRKVQEILLCCLLVSEFGRQAKKKTRNSQLYIPLRPLFDLNTSNAFTDLGDDGALCKGASEGSCSPKLPVGDLSV